MRAKSVQCRLAVFRDAVDYDPATGRFTWRDGYRGAFREAGHFDAKGYRMLSVRGVRELAHRVAWAMTYGRWPEGVIDHINGERDDNRIDNLRDVSVQANAQNTRSTSRNPTGLRGVAYRRAGAKRYSARIVVDGRCRWLGSYATAEEAHAAYLVAKSELHPFAVNP